MKEVEELRKEIEKIKERNQKVEADKAWETSLTRRVFVAVATYVLIAIVMRIIGVDEPLISAVIPTAGYLLSTISLGKVKEWWIKRRG